MLPVTPPELPPPRPELNVAQVYEDGIVVALVTDSTDSTLSDYHRYFLERAAETIEKMGEQSGQGAITAFLIPITANAGNSRNVQLAIHLSANPRQPTRDQPIGRPEQPDFDGLCASPFSRGRCVEYLRSVYVAELDAAVREESEVQARYELALATFDEQMALAAAASQEAAAQIRNFMIPSPTCSDVFGALVLAAHIIEDSASPNAKRVLLVQTDGEVTCGAKSLDASFAGIGVTVILDCKSECTESEEWLVNLLLEAGAQNVRVMTPAVFEVTGLGEVMP